MPIINKCCCFSVCTGSIIVGWVGLIVGVVFLCVIPVPLALFQYNGHRIIIPDENTFYTDGQGEESNATLTIADYDNDDDDDDFTWTEEELKAKHKDELIALCFVIIGGLMRITANILLLFGISKEVRGLVKTWLIIFPIYEIFYLIGLIVLWNSLWNIFIIAYVIFSVICLICVYSYYDGLAPSLRSNPRQM